MTLENPLLVGIILIIVGIATALLAAAIMLNRKDEEAGQKVDTLNDDDGIGDVSTQTRSAQSPPPPQPQHDIPAGTDGSKPQVSDPAPAISHPPISIPETTSAASSPALASFKRDSHTGELLLTIGGREYKSPEDLHASSDWPLVKDSLEELTTWIGKTPPQSLRPAGVARQKPVAAEKNQSRSKRQTPAPQLPSMVEQINEIIQEKLRSSGKTHLSVRLIEGLHGEIKALIGVESYPLHDIPDPEVQAFIKECVAEWEQKT